MFARVELARWTIKGRPDAPKFNLTHHTMVQEEFAICCGYEISRTNFKSIISSIPNALEEPDPLVPPGNLERYLGVYDAWAFERKVPGPQREGISHESACMVYC